MKTILCILDGVGIPDKDGLLIPFIQKNMKKAIYLEASGQEVGLIPNQMGNSEVGHMTIGSGRIIKQNLPKIDDAIAFDTFPVLEGSGDNYHLVGLLSDGGVHSHINHVLFLIERLKKYGKKIYLHLITDGRDTSPRSAEKYFGKIKPLLDETCRIATIGGRYYGMDRDNRMERTKLAYEAIILGKSQEVFDSAEDFVTKSYIAGLSDEFFIPSCGSFYRGVEAADTLVFYNFRSDRMRQLVKMINSKKKVKNIISMVDYFDGMMPNIQPIFHNDLIKNTLGEILARSGKKQLRIAETEKYAHVTFFFNCGVEKPYKGEDRILLPSPKISTYDLQPEMAAYEITEKLTEAIQTGKYDFICVNFANADMVGHTGNLKAAQKACEVLDDCLEKLVKVAVNNNYLLLITADHGNIEKMFDQETNQPHTAHTLNKVPFICINDGIDKVDSSGVIGLKDIAPTVLGLMNLPIPKDMSGRQLFVVPKE